MKRSTKPINIVIAGLGGQGVIKASEILATVVFRAGLDVKKAEVHGMSQRGGSVTTDVRFGETVLSPMVPPGEADFLVVTEPSQVDNNLWRVREGGIVIEPGQIDESALANKKSINVALLGKLSTFFEFPEELWRDAIRSNLPEKLHEANFQAFRLGQAFGLPV